MQKVFFGLLISLIMVPLSTFADDFQSTVQSWSDSGGNVVGAGGVVTTGESQSSVHAVTIVNGNSSGTSTVDITTSVNGVVHHETITKPVVPGIPAIIDVGTSTGAHINISIPQSSVHIHVHQNVPGSSTSSVSTSIHATSSAAASVHVTSASSPFNFASVAPTFSVLALFNAFLAFFGFR